MIITRTPFRISFFGGGTDFPEWYREHGGSVISTSIDKYCYITCRYLPPFFKYKHRLVYSIIENVSKIDDINHPSVRECLRWAKPSNGLEIHHDGDLPARSGVGSSSSFTVGLLHALHALNQTMITKKELAKLSIFIEQKKIKENVGSQDQIVAAFGGFNYINFNKVDLFDVQRLILNKNNLNNLKQHLILLYTGQSRIASDIEKNKIHNLHKKKNQLHEIQSYVKESFKLFTANKFNPKNFGEMLHETFMLKKELSDLVTNDEINRIYDKSLKNGAYGGKILGAGGGGFLLLVAPPSEHTKLKKVFNKYTVVPFDFEDEGSKVVLFQPKGFN